MQNRGHKSCNTGCGETGGIQGWIASDPAWGAATWLPQHKPWGSSSLYSPGQNGGAEWCSPGVPVKVPNWSGCGHFERKSLKTMKVKWDQWRGPQFSMNDNIIFRKDVTTENKTRGWRYEDPAGKWLAANQMGKPLPGPWQMSLLQSTVSSDG